LLPDEIIPKDAASDALNWLTREGRIELSYGRQTVGGAGASGKNYGEHVGYRADGTEVRFRKVNTTIQYLNGSTWTNVITGLTENADYTFANYQSLAGAFVYCFGIDGIYKIATANPANFASLFNSAKNFKGFGLIDKGRTILWGRAEDPTGLYGSYIDAQNSTVYTTVTGESITAVESGTLAFKAGGATRTCFGVQITDTSSGEVFTDNFNGVLRGSLGNTGTINYMTGAFTIAGQTGAGTATYQWEDSNAKGVTDFSKSATRLAGEGFVLRQDAGGDAIRTVIPLDGSYFSLKANSCYRLELDSADVNPFNELYRTDIGVQTLRSAVGTGAGIVFINTANPTKPKLQIIQRNPLGDNFDTQPLFAQFAFENYVYNDASLDTWDEYVIMACKTMTAVANDRLLLCNVKDNTVSPTYYGARSFAKVDGVLYAGDSVSTATYELFTGFDDLGLPIENYFVGNGETYGSDVLKKTKKYRFKGKIDPNQQLAIYISQDDGGFTQIGTVRGDGSYVDYGTSFAVGTAVVGTTVIGGEATSNVYQFWIELKFRASKFRKRKFKFEAQAIGFVSIEQVIDFDIWTYQEKLPAKYRSKQNVSIDGTQTDVANPPY
jgi:hypothetical protein